MSLSTSFYLLFIYIIPEHSRVMTWNCLYLSLQLQHTKCWQWTVDTLLSRPGWTRQLSAWLLLELSLWFFVFWVIILIIIIITVRCPYITKPMTIFISEKGKQLKSAGKNLLFGWFMWQLYTYYVTSRFVSHLSPGLERAEQGDAWWDGRELLQT